VDRKVKKGSLEFGKEGEVMLLAGRERVNLIVATEAATHRGCSRGAFSREGSRGFPIV
jgi:hypothetical protein